MRKKDENKRIQNTGKVMVEILRGQATDFVPAGDSLGEIAPWHAVAEEQIRVAGSLWRKRCAAGVGK